MHPVSALDFSQYTPFFWLLRPSVLLSDLYSLQSGRIFRLVHCRLVAHFCTLLFKSDDGSAEWQLITPIHDDVVGWRLYVFQFQGKTVFLSSC
jgi:hypothetical protein